VSRQTVSRVINYRPDVSQETRQRVLDVITDLGYRPSSVARTLAQGRSNTLGVVGFGLEYFGPTRVLAGIERRSSERSLSLQLGLLDNVLPQRDLGRVEQVMNDLLSRQVDGIIWAVPGHVESTEWVAARFEKMAIPTVFLNRNPSPSQDVVAMDGRHGGRLAVDHLLAQGYRRIGTVSGPNGWWEAEEREAGWREALQGARVDDAEDLRIEGQWSAASGEQAFRVLYRKAPDIEAVFAANDQMALGVVHAARQLGLQVPKDLAVVGFDDIDEAPYFHPSLTTVRQDLNALGTLAVDRIYRKMLVQQPEEDRQGGISWVRPRLVVRESSLRD